jgi:hypothetical protein
MVGVKRRRPVLVQSGLALRLLPEPQASQARARKEAEDKVGVDVLCSYLWLCLRLVLMSASAPGRHEAPLCLLCMVYVYMAVCLWRVVMCVVFARTCAVRWWLAACCRCCC